MAAAKCESLPPMRKYSAMSGSGERNRDYEEK